MRAEYKSEFISFLVRSGALQFGSFTTKSGRSTPYFVNTGAFDDGAKISALGSFYARHMVENGLGSADVVFGPAYKGIPLCVEAASALHREHSLTCGFAFDRKEEKLHGDRGRFVGRTPKTGDRVVIVEDVVTAGTTLKQIVPALRDLGVEIVGIVVSVDRMERGSGALSAVRELEESLSIRILPIVTIDDIVDRIEKGALTELGVDISFAARIREYLDRYGSR